METNLKLTLLGVTAMERIFEIDLSSEEKVREAVIKIRYEAACAELDGTELVLELWRNRKPFKTVGKESTEIRLPQVR